ncbi:MAG: SDR family NAD(P)-dependent oxidoreductase, partial [Pacificimonas sp.]
MSIDLPRTPDQRLDGRRALVTGAGRGIGLACAAALAEAGAHVVLIARNRIEIDEASAAICQRGESAEAQVLDVSDLTAVEAFFNEQSAFDIVVNNAGTNRPKPMTEVDEADYDAVLDLNLKSLFFVSQFCARGMISEKSQASLI